VRPGDAEKDPGEDQVQGTAYAEQSLPGDGDLLPIAVLYSVLAGTAAPADPPLSSRAQRGCGT
jgi:hypothetical protein